MLLPLMGLFMVFIPGAGFLAGVFFLCVKRLRFLALFAFLMPLCGSYAALFGFWGAAIGLESLGASESVSAIGGLVCFFLAGGLGVLIGGLGAWTIYRHAESRRQRKLAASE